MGGQFNRNRFVHSVEIKIKHFLRQAVCKLSKEQTLKYNYKYCFKLKMSNVNHFLSQTDVFYDDVTVDWLYLMSNLLRKRFYIIMRVKLRNTIECLPPKGVD